MSIWDRIPKIGQVVIAFGVIWGGAQAVAVTVPTVFHTDAEAGELWAANDRELACKEALELEEKILTARIRLASENLSPEVEALIDTQIEKWVARREQIRQEHGC